MRNHNLNRVHVLGETAYVNFRTRWAADHCETALAVEGSRLEVCSEPILKWGVAHEGARWSITSEDEMLGKRNLPRSISHNTAVGMMPGRSTGT